MENQQPPILMHHKKNHHTTIGLTLLVGVSAWVQAGDGVPVSSISTLRTTAIPSGPYVISGDTITYGTGDNVRITNALSSGFALSRSAVSKPTISIKRKNNPIVQGERLTLFYPGTVTGSSVNIEGDEATSMEQAMNDDYLTSGGLDVFLNQDSGVERANNIERVDYVLHSGLTLPTTPALLLQVGTIANEKHGNNTYKIALITAVDFYGNPTAFGPLKTVQGNVDYGNVGRPTDSMGNNLRNLYLRNGPTPTGGTNGPVAYIRSDTNIIGLSFLSFAALGATAGQTVYGYSLFPNDMLDSNDLVGLTDAPLTTSGSINGGDIYGGTFAIFSTAAAEAETNEEPEVEITIEKSVETYDPLSGNRKALPGHDVLYTITVTNDGIASPDADSVFLVDEIPAETTVFFGDVDDAGPETDPVRFTDSGSALTFNFSTDAGYSRSATPPSDLAACNDTPNNPYDQSIRFVCFQMRGTMAAAPTPPSFSLQFRTRIK